MPLVETIELLYIYIYANSLVIQPALPDISNRHLGFLLPLIINTYMKGGYISDFQY